jgi:hypothetical protein
MWSHGLFNPGRTRTVTDDFSQRPYSQTEWIAHAQRLLDSYRRLLGRELIEREGTPEEQSRRLFDAPFAVLSHGTQADPILNYANRTTLELWETDLPTLLATPSRLTAEPVHRDERARLLARVTRDGYIDDYSGIRISRTSRRFLIDRAVVWNITDEDGQYIGQAATFGTWRFLEA